MKMIASPLFALLLAACLFGQEKSFESLPCEDSTAIEFARFFPKTGKMEMAFKGRPEKVYTFDYFPGDIWLMWCASESKGTFYHRNIKGVKFERSKKESDSGLIKRAGMVGIKERSDQQFLPGSAD